MNLTCLGPLVIDIRILFVIKGSGVLLTTRTYKFMSQNAMYIFLSFSFTKLSSQGGPCEENFEWIILYGA
jgi:hypothetical protein